MPHLGYALRTWTVPAPCNGPCGLWTTQGATNPSDTNDPPSNVLCELCLHRLLSSPETFEDTVA
jgi:hypothetical protein